jgi:Nif-specific regulatory protein
MQNEIYQLEIKVLYEISGIIGQILSLDMALKSILAILSQSLYMERATVTLKDKKTGLLKILASHSLHPDEVERGIYEPDEGITGQIFHTAQPFAVPDIGREPLFLNKTRSRKISKESIAFIGVPIILNGEPIGVFSVDRLFKPEVHFEEDIHFLTIVATLIAQFVKLNQEVEKHQKSIITENRFLRAEISEKYNHFSTVGVSHVMHDLNRMIQKVAPSKASVLLLGESGTGKTLTARIIHELSNRSRGPFIKVNCAALPENLIESELFGYEKGAFTGAGEAKAGRLEEASTGTVFLDEIGELPLLVQSKLLHFLQERELVRLGSTRARIVDVRIVAATNADLSQAVKKGSFREDLCYRLNEFSIAIPPLRERKADIPLLVDYFLEKTSKDYGRRLHFTDECLDILMGYRWPGNVRELENFIERMAIMTDSALIDKAFLPVYLIKRNGIGRVPDETGTGISDVEKMERDLVLEALERNNWIQQNAARDIGLTLRQMGYRIKKFGLDDIIHNAKKKSTAQYRCNNLQKCRSVLHGA